ncbi:MAG: hypothetical protein ACREC5_06240, partial [Thermoplasmata archaeon]
MKFGGSTLGASDRIAEAARRVAESDPPPSAVVVSAPGELTDTILGLAVGPPAADSAPLARALALGEALGASLMAAALQARGVPVRLVLPGEADWPLLARGDPLRAEIDLDLSRPRARRLLTSDGPIVVLPGFVGIDAGTGEVSTLGRGGSDTSAVALGRLLGRSEVILVKDVPGVLEADPRLVPEARPLSELSVEEMDALARGGASVVAASALAYMSEEILLRVIAIGEPFDRPTGTVIRARSRSAPPSSDSAKEPGPGPDGPGWGLVTAIPKG